MVIRSKYSTYTSDMLKKEATDLCRDYRRAGLTGMECCELLELEHSDLVYEMNVMHISRAECVREANKLNDLEDKMKGDN